MTFVLCTHTGPTPAEAAKLEHDTASKTATITVGGIHGPTHGRLVAVTRPSWADAAFAFRHDDPAAEGGEVSASFVYSGKTIDVAFRDASGEFHIWQDQGNNYETHCDPASW